MSFRGHFFETSREKDDVGEQHKTKSQAFQVRPRRGERRTLMTLGVLVPSLVVVRSGSPSSLLQAISNRATGQAPDSGYSMPSTSAAGALGNGPDPPLDEPGIVPQPAGLPCANAAPSSLPSRPGHARSAG